MHRNEKRAVAVVDGGSALCTGETVVDGDDSDGADGDDDDDGADAISDGADGADGADGDDGDDGETVVNGGSALCTGEKHWIKVCKSPTILLSEAQELFINGNRIENFWKRRFFWINPAWRFAQ